MDVQYNNSNLVFSSILLKTRIISELKNGLCHHRGGELTVQERVMTLLQCIASRVFKIKSILYGRVKIIAIISIILIISISYGLFFYFQDITESSVKNSLFVQQRDRQIIATRDLSQHIASDLSLVTARLDGLSNSYLRQGDLTSNKAKGLMQDNFLNIDHLFVVNKNNIITIDIAARGAKTFVGTNVSHREYLTQARKSLAPVFSNGYIGLDGKTRIGISYPIINTQTGRYFGLVVAVVPIVQFFSNYENVYNIQSRFLVAYDKNKDYISIYSKDTIFRKELFCT